LVHKKQFKEIFFPPYYKMPCITGRSSHVLCNPGCADANACCRQTTSFSADKYCFCRESTANPNNQLANIATVRNALCDALSLETFDGTDLTLGNVSGVVCGANLPSYNCAVDVYIQQGSGALMTVNTVLNGACTGDDTDATALAAGEWKLLLDSYECLTFTNTVTP